MPPATYQDRSKNYFFSAHLGQNKITQLEIIVLQKQPFTWLLFDGLIKLFPVISKKVLKYLQIQPMLIIGSLKNENKLMIPIIQPKNQNSYIGNYQLMFSINKRDNR